MGRLLKVVVFLYVFRRGEEGFLLRCLLSCPDVSERKANGLKVEIRLLATGLDERIHCP